MMLSRLSHTLPGSARANRIAANLLSSRGFAVPAADTADNHHSWQLGASALAAFLAAGLGSLMLLQPETSHCEEAKLASAGQTQARPVDLLSAFTVIILILPQLAGRPLSLSAHAVMAFYNPLVLGN